jgi:hypothetical protein
LQLNKFIIFLETGFREQTVTTTSTEDFPAMFAAEVTKARLKLPVLQDQSLDISLEDFVKLFIAENAPMSFKAYHEQCKDTNVVVTCWEPMSENLGSGREIRFFKPVNLPGLASTRGVKVQRYAKFGDFGLLICSSTTLEDVPAADSFRVDDMLAVS